MAKRQRKEKKPFRMSAKEYDAVFIPFIIKEYNLIQDKKSPLTVSEREEVVKAAKKLIDKKELFVLYDGKVERQNKKVEIIIPHTTDNPYGDIR